MRLFKAICIGALITLMGFVLVAVSLRDLNAGACVLYLSGVVAGCCYLILTKKNTPNK